MSEEPAPAPSTPEGEPDGEGRGIREERHDDGHWHLERWEVAWPAVAAGITGSDGDFGLNGGEHAWRITERYEGLARATGCAAVAVGRQVHGRRVGVVDGRDWSGVLVTGDHDAHVTRSPGLLLAATAADCVPVYLLAPDVPAWGLAHAGWRGVAAGVLESTLDSLDREYGVTPGRLHLHVGPAICGECYEVGPEVVEALGPDAVVVTDDRSGVRVDLRSTLLRRAARAGVRSDRMSRSRWCTCCSGDQFRSYRCSDGTPGRMAAFLGWRGGRGGVAAVPPDR